MSTLDEYMKQVEFDADGISVGGVAIPGCVSADGIEVLEDVGVGGHYTIRLTLLTGVEPTFGEGVTIDVDGNVRVSIEAQP